MAKRAGEKVGWIGGWLGAFLWVLILSLVMVSKGRIPEASAGMGLFTAAILCVLLLAPWRFPGTRCWILMLPLYLGMFLAIPWAIWAFGSGVSGLNPWQTLMLLPILLPLFTLGRRRWDERA